MTYTPATRLDSAAQGGWTRDDMLAMAEAAGAKRLPEVRRLLDTIYSQDTINPELAAWLSAHETDRWRSGWWESRLNPAGMGITGDAAQDAVSPTFPSGIVAARAMLTHLALYCFGTELPAGFPWSAVDDPRWQAAVQAGYAGIAPTLGGLTNRWAKDDRYAEKIVALLNAREGTGPMIEGFKNVAVLVVAGHRSETDPGNRTERDLTDELARADVEAFRAAGIQATWWQRDADNDNLPDLTRGGLDEVALGCGAWLAKQSKQNPETLYLMLDDHYNGPSSPVHVIVPDNVGLGTAYVQGRNAYDTAANNTLDVQLAQAIAQEINARTGRPLFTGILKIPGVMSERETGVALQYSARLAMFAATAPSRLNAIRVVIEHGGFNDPQMRNAELLAEAKVAAVKRVFELTEPSKPTEPATEPAYPFGFSTTAVTRLFDAVKGDDGRLYGFDPRGPVSKLWLAHGQETGQFPRLVDVFTDGDAKVFVFGDGLVIRTARDGQTPVLVAA